MASETKKTTQGFPVVCPECGAKDSMLIRLSDVHALQCDECDVEITAEELRERIDRWTVILAWLDTAPLLAE